VALLDIDHLNGFAVRLHNLGDFYSVKYVELWRGLLERHSALHVWGYTARWQVEDDPIAAALVALVQSYWNRFAIRFSNAPFPFRECPTTITVETRHQKPADAILCPEQVGKTESCSTCGFVGKPSAASRSFNIGHQRHAAHPLHPWVTAPPG
jgi:hypothetical protein